MQTIVTKVNISEDHKLIIQLPANIPVGEYEVVLVLNNPSPQHKVHPSIAEAHTVSDNRVQFLKARYHYE
ncbi:MAG: hypothetical protein KME29_01570 [Calothrix sp. FI2-JRJ7]|jgi:hypothetical protein|nr:hypothetical protein [Calothrix sp. FI2-JRJ7]